MSRTRVLATLIASALILALPASASAARAIKLHLATEWMPMMGSYEIVPCLNGGAGATLLLTGESKLVGDGLMSGGVAKMSSTLYYRGVAVDQSNGDEYVASGSKSLSDLTLKVGSVSTVRGYMLFAGPHGTFTEALLDRFTITSTGVVTADVEFDTARPATCS